MAGDGFKELNTIRKWLITWYPGRDFEFIAMSYGMNHQLLVFPAMHIFFFINFPNMADK